MCCLAPDIKLRKRHRRESRIDTGSFALKEKDAGTYICGGRDLTMIFEGSDLQEAERDVVVSADVASGFGVEEAVVALLKKATKPATASSHTGEEDIAVSL